MRPHTRGEADAVVEAIAEWQEVFRAALGRRLAYASDEYYLLAGREFPDAEEYDGFPQHENGVGMARAFELELAGKRAAAPAASGFFQWVEGAPASGYRAPRAPLEAVPVRLGTDRLPPSIVTGEYGAAVLRPLLDRAGFTEVELLAVRNELFGGNIAVTGLLAGADVGRALAQAPSARRYLLPDVCLSKGVFLDGVEVGDLPRPVEVVPTDGTSLRRALEGSRSR
jgi:NifB/MoaA-like Fe-S oxidoreductase